MIKNKMRGRQILNMVLMEALSEELTTKAFELKLICPMCLDYALSMNHDIFSENTG